MKYRLVVWMIVLALVPIRAGAQDETATVTLKTDPAKTHQLMWQQLQPRLAARQAGDKSIAAVTATNWQEYDMFFYRLDLTIDYSTEMVYGRVGTHGRPTVTSLDSVMVNLNTVLTVDSVYNAAGNLAFTHANHYLTVHLDRAYVEGEEFAFTVVYQGTPPSTGLMGFSFDTHNGLPLVTTLSEPYGAHDWWPCNDITIDKADSVDVIITTATNLVVSSNGLQVSDVDNGNGTHTVWWKERYPIATYLVSIALYPYAVWGDWYHYSPTDSMPLTYFVYPDREAASHTQYAYVPGMLDILGARYGLYPFINEKYGMSHFGWGGAMEHQTNTSAASSDWGMGQDVVVHELSHQWWGDMVTCADWHHIWINEGFAVFSEAVYFEGLYGSSYYHNYMNNFEYSSGGSIYIQDTTDVWNIFGSIVYDKGGWVLHMLRHVLGDELFFQSLRDYRDQYVWSNATTEQFRDVVEATTGMDLDWFFQQWIYGTYRPNYRSSYLAEADPSGGWNIYLHLRQLQITNPQLFIMPVDVRITTASGNTTQVVFNDRRAQNFILHSDEQPTAVVIDPDRWISRTLGTESYSLHIVNDSLADGQQGSAYADTVLVKGGTGTYKCELISGTLPTGWTLQSSTGIISGLTTASGSFTFQVRATDLTYPSYKDSVAYTVDIQELAARPGDANFDGVINVGDAIFIINYVFRSGPAPIMPAWADANADCNINVGDAVYLVNYVFRSGPAPILGCAD